MLASINLHRLTCSSFRQAPLSLQPDVCTRAVDCCYPSVLMSRDIDRNRSVYSKDRCMGLRESMLPRPHASGSHGTCDNGSSNSAQQVSAAASQLRECKLKSLLAAHARIGYALRLEARGSTRRQNSELMWRNIIQTSLP